MPPTGIPGGPSLGEIEGDSDGESSDGGNDISGDIGGIFGDAAGDSGGDDGGGGIATDVTEDVQELEDGGGDDIDTGFFDNEDDGGGGGGGIATDIAEDIENLDSSDAGEDDNNGGGQGSSDQITDTAGKSDASDTSDEPADIINLTSNDPRYRPDLFRDPAQQEQFTERFEQRLRQQFGDPSIVLGPEDIEFVEEDGTVRGTVRGDALLRSEAVQEVVDRRQREADAGLETFLAGAVRPFEEQRQLEAERRVLEGAAQLFEGAVEPFSGQAESGGEPDTAQRVENALERRVGARRAEAAGITNPVLREGVIEGANLDAGEDFTLEETADGDVSAALTPEFVESETRRMATRQAEQQFGLDLREGDIEIVETDEGGFRAELTEQGAARVATQPLTEAVSGFEEKTGVDIPGEGPLLAEIDSDRDLGNIEIPVRMGPEDEFTTFDAALDDVEQRIIEATSDQGPAIEFQEDRPGRAGAGIRTERRAFTGEGRTPVVQFSESALRSIPLFATGAVGLTKDVAEFNAAAVEAAAAGDFERLEELKTGVKEAATEKAVLAASSAVDDPGEFVARGLGTLAGSAVLFGGARAIGPKTSLATRAAVQPGEEIAGFGGNRLTRAVAGERTAQRLFPDNEPLIFSEEAAIRNIGRASRRIQQRAESIRAAAETEGVAAKFRAAEFDPRADIEPRPLFQGIRRRLTEERKSLEFRMAELDPRSDIRTPDTGEVEFVDDASPAGFGAMPRVEARTETETLRDFDQEAEGGFATRQETRQQVEQPELETESEPDIGARRIESAFNEDEILAGVESRAAAAEVSELRQRGLIEPASESIGSFDIDQELDSELENLLEQELESEQEAEVELEQELIRELEAEQEVEQELEFESEVESEAEQEAETDFVFDTEPPEEAPIEENLPFADKLFESGIADVEEAAQIEDRILGEGGETATSRQSPEDIEREILGE